MLKSFSADCANAVSAIAAAGTLLLAAFTLWFLYREYRNKYRPYVVVGILPVAITGTGDFEIVAVPRNVGPHPCEFKLLDIRLHIGDETYETPAFKEWMLIAPQGMEVRVPVGRLNQLGIARVREARYKSNRIEVAFKLAMRSTEGRLESAKVVTYEVFVHGEVPFAAIRPEWSKDA
jgi:hypothetical protein